MNILETSFLLIWSITALFAALGVVCVGRVIQLYFSERTDVLAKELEERKNELNQQMQDVRKKREELEKERNQLRQAGEEVDDLDWRINDTDWRLKDLDWEIRDTKWEVDDRVHQRRTSMATFWTASGAAFFALASLVFSIGRALIQ